MSEGTVMSCLHYGHDTLRVRQAEARQTTCPKGRQGEGGGSGGGGEHEQRQDGTNTSKVRIIVLRIAV